MSEIKRVKIDSILESQIPEFIQEDSPLFVEFLRQYYKSLEYQSGTVDLAVNLKKYKNIEKFNNTDLTTSTTLTDEVLSFDDVISVTSTVGWPDTYGLLKINDEIITYTSKTENSFVGCIRGFSGVDNIESFEKSSFLNFSSTSSAEHQNGSVVTNLSNLFLVKFFEKYKLEFLPGFENRDFNPNVSIENVLINARNFYLSKGTDTSYKFLFQILYGSDIEVINPNDYTIKPSSDTFFVTKNILVEKIFGDDPVNTKGNFLLQELPGIGTASASIYNIEYRPVSGKDLYEISLDSSSISGTFVVTGQTKVLETIPVGADNIIVDSTVGFSKSGKILAKPENSDFIEISYTDKTTNQFLGVTGVTKELEFGLSLVEDKFAYSYVGFGNTSRVDFRVLNVIEDIDIQNSNNLKVGDTIKLVGFGQNLAQDFRFNSWITNIPTKHNVKSFSQESVDKFRLFLHDEIIFYKEEFIKIYDENNEYLDAQIIDIDYNSGDTIRKFSATILVQIFGLGSTSFNTGLIDKIQKIIYKTNHQTNYFPNINKYPSGIQNTYIDKNFENFYVTSTGIPNYTIFLTDDKREIQTLEQNDRSAQYVGLTSILNVPSHNYVNGNLVYYDTFNYSNSGVSTGFYYVSVYDSNNIKLSFSKADVFSKKYVEFKSGVSGDTIVIGGYENKNLEHQRLVRKFPFEPKPSTIDDVNERTTRNRAVGMLVNGTELLSPTYFDENIFYGKVDFIDVTNGGSGYDVVNPPPIDITDVVGIGAKAHVNLSGSIQSVKLIYPGVGYQSKPKINISGGNGKGCSLESNLVSSRITQGFKADVATDTPSNSISLLTPAIFDDGEEVIYNSNTNSDIPGIVNGSFYYVGIITETRIKLYNNKTDAVNKTNEINLTGISSGFHFFSTSKNKNTITEIYVKNPGEGYSNRTIKVPSVLSFDNKTTGINTFDSYIYARNHGFSNAELVVYSTTNSAISGMSTENYYHVSVIDKNRFKLSLAGTANSISDDNYFNQRYIKFDTLGVGTHSISYPPIVISVESVSSLGSTSIITPVLEPVVLGSIDDVYVIEGGVGYGCTDIINFHRRPDVGISSVKSEALLKPIVVDGKIVDVQIVQRGRGYRVDSDIFVSGSGSFAKIEPVIDPEGRLSSVQIVDGGVGYGVSDTTLLLKNRGTGARFLSNVTQWTVDQVKKLGNLININDDGVLLNSRNELTGLQFCSYYVPKKLRYQLSDNFTQDNKETDEALRHSPILGYAYDGNPIYGPYGYASVSGGSVRQIVSSYSLSAETDSGLRPPSFVPGYFVNDYSYNGFGDLDEYNGRWCVTPEYPNGVYAYFYSVDVDISRVAKNRYPYIIGPQFNNKPVDENFLPSFNQDENIFTNEIVRNTGPYYLNYSESSYDLIDKVFENYKQEFRVSKINTGTIENISIFSKGKDYKIGDKILVDNKNTNGYGANIVVSEIGGKEVENASIVKRFFSDCNIIPKNNTFKIVFDQPHGLVDKEPISISGISTISLSLLEKTQIIKVDSKTVQLLEDIGLEVSTGVSTFIKVKDLSGFSDNDFIGIGTENLLITKVSPERSGFYVNRLENTGIHTAGLEFVTLKPKSLEFSNKLGFNKLYQENYVTFFNPIETVGTGTDGITRTVVGFGGTFESRNLRARTIYIPGHKFYTGQPLTYNIGLGGTSLYANQVGSAVSFAIYNNQTVYAVNFDRDHIGISTVGFTTISGIGTDLNSVEFWTLEESYGVIGAAHSLTTQFDTIRCSVTRNSGVVTTKTDHGLVTSDIIDLKVEDSSTNEYSLYFDNVNRKILVNKISFTNAEVSTDDNTIDIASSELSLKNGDKVAYFAENAIGGLQSSNIYFVLKKDNYKISLCNNKTDINSANEISFTAFSAGGSQDLYLVNPPITVYEGSKLKFDLSDPSLVDLRLEFYSDNTYTKRVELIGSVESSFAITRFGTSGSAGSYVQLDTSIEGFPNLLFYTLKPASPLDTTKNQISFDTDVVGRGQLKVVKHPLTKKLKTDLIIDSKTFSFNSDKKLTDSDIEIFDSATPTYSTASKTAQGPIEDVKINFEGRGYTRLPLITGVDTDRGKDAVLRLISNNIGKVELIERVKDGFDYPTDLTLSPQLGGTVVVGIKDIRTIDRINILNGGKNYNSAPLLFVKGNDEIELVSGTSLGAVVDAQIIKNSTSLAEPLEIIPIFNSNGYDIDNISVVGDSVTLELLNNPTLNPLVTIGYGRTEIDFPFSEGDEIFVENCKLTPNTSGLANFNSEKYDHSFFTVTGVNTTNYTVTYSMSGISTGTFGTYSDERPGTVVNKKDMASFEMILVDDVTYQSSEKVTAFDFSARVLENGWTNELNQLRVTDAEGLLRVGDKITGEESNTVGTVEYLNDFLITSDLGVLRDKTLPSNLYGILNDSQQRISDNFYYQKFAYSLRSNVPYETWRESVRSIVHPSGFKEFSDYTLFTKPSENSVTVGIAKSINMKPTLSQSDSVLSINVDSENSFYNKNNFALVYEDLLLDNGYSENVFIDIGPDLKPFILNKTNKIVVIDDIGDQFTGDLTVGGAVVGLSSFKLTNNGTSLFKHVFDSSDAEIIDVETNTFNIVNHNYQIGHELSYVVEDGSPIGIATTSYVGVAGTILMQVGNIEGTAILENGYPVAITTTVTGVSTVLSPVGPSFKQYTQVVGNGTTGTDATFNVLITYSPSTGQPLSTSVVLTSGGSGYSLGESVSIAGTFMGGVNPTNDLTFVISNVGPSGIQTQANETYLDVPSNDSNGATFNVTRNGSGYVSDVQVVNGGAGYSQSSVVSIAGTYIGGDTNDYIEVTPLVLGVNKLPSVVYSYKLNDNQFALLGLSTSVSFLEITDLGTGNHSLSYTSPNASSIISIDGVVQPPIRTNLIDISLTSPVSSASTTIISVSSGINSVSTGEILNIDQEYMLIKTLSVGSSEITVEREFLGSSSGIHTVGAAVTVLVGSYNIIGDTVFFTQPPYGPTGPVGLETRSSFNGRVFSRQFDGTESVDQNLVIDDISRSFTGIAATDFTITVNGSTTTTLYNDINASTLINNIPLIFIDNVFQVPNKDFTVDGTGANVLRFLSGTPSAGKISKVSISTSFGYQPRIVATADAVVSVSGTISSVILDGLGSGYRNPPVVSLASTVGTGASLVAVVGTSGTTLGQITEIQVVDGGTGYAITSPPRVVIGIPTGYSNLNIDYIDGTSGNGQKAKVTVTVGQGSSITSFKFDDPGIGYKTGDQLKVVGIPTVSDAVVEELVFTVDEVQSSTFNGLYPGQFIIFDDISFAFNNFRTKFTLSITESGIRQVLNLNTVDGSDLDITNNIFVFINDILQAPQKAYTFRGSRIIFTEPPVQNSSCTVLYYRGSYRDIEEIAPPETLKPGDVIQIKENRNDLFDQDQTERIIKNLNTSDQFTTFVYGGVGIVSDVTKSRPLNWKKQTTDRIISGSLYSKARTNLKSKLYPTATVIKDIAAGDTEIYVDNAFPLFSEIDGLNENLRDFTILENKLIQEGTLSCTVSGASTVSSISVTFGGVGYANTLSPKVVVSESAIKLKDPVYNWSSTIVSGVTTTDSFNAVSAGKQFVAVGNSSLYSYSFDGTNWVSGNVGVGSTVNLTSIHAVGSGSTDVIYTVGTLGKVSYATGYANTLTSWTELPLKEDVTLPGVGVIGENASAYVGTLNGISFGSNSWVTVGTGGSIFSSPGLTTSKLTNRYSGVIADLNGIVYGNGYFTSVGNNGTVITSNDGTIWDIHLNGVPLQNFNDVGFDGTQILIVGDNATIVKSLTRDTYQPISNNINSSENIIKIRYTDGLYLVLTSVNKLYYSFDLSDWTYRSTLQSNNINDLVSVDSLLVDGGYVAVGAAATIIKTTATYHKATAESTVSNGEIVSVTVTDGGFGYVQDNIPVAIVESDNYKKETVKSFKVTGDYGSIVGVNTFLAGTPGIGTTSPKLEFVLQSETYDNSTLGIGYSSLNSFGISYSQLTKGDYFVISNSNVQTDGNLVAISTFLGGMSNYPNSIVGIATSFIDGVYVVEDVTSPSLGIVTVTCHFAPDYDNAVSVSGRGEYDDINLVFSGINTNGFYGRYSWSKLYDFQNRSLSLQGGKSFETYTENGLTGLSTAPKLIRTKPVTGQ